MKLEIVNFKAKLPDDFGTLLGFKVNGVSISISFLLQDGFVYFPTDIDFDTVEINYKPKITD